MKKWQLIAAGAFLGGLVVSLAFVGIRSHAELTGLRQQNEELKLKLATKDSNLDLFSHQQSNASPFAFGSPLLNDSFEEMRKRMDQFMNDSFFDHGFGDHWQTSLPSVEVEDLSEKYLVTVQPFDPDRYEVETEIEGQYLKLNISSKNHGTEETQNDKGSYKEYYSGNSQITKQVYLRDQFDPEGMDISIEKNLLEIEIPKLS